jgi:site-specific DNA-methyltransferase (adenine-specific)
LIQPYYQSEQVTLYNADCLEAVPQLEAQSVDAILTDVPYGTTACSWDVVIPFPEMWKVVKHVLKKKGAFVTTASQPFTSKLVCSNLEWFRDEWIWDKVNGANFGNVKYSPFRTHENIEVFCDGLPKTYNPIYRKVSKPFGKISLIQSEVTASKLKPTKQGVGYPSTIIRIMRPNNLSDGGLHPTQKPEALYRYLALTYTNPDNVILDFCMGSGTTGVACVQTGRRFVGIEISKDYCDIAVKRIKDAEQQMRLF